MFGNKNKAELTVMKAEVDGLKGLTSALEKSMAVVELGLDGKILRANDNFLATMGYRADELTSKTHRDFCEPEVLRSREYADLWASLKAGKFISGTFKRINKNGQSVWLEASYNPVTDTQGKVVKVVKYALDVTRRVMLENETNSKLAAVDRAMAVCEFEPNGNVITANANFLHVMGYALAEIKGKHHRSFCEPSLVNSPEYSEFWRKLNNGEFIGDQFKRLASMAGSSGLKPPTTRSSMSTASSTRSSSSPATLPLGSKSRKPTRTAPHALTTSRQKPRKWPNKARWSFRKPRGKCVRSPKTSARRRSWSGNSGIAPSRSLPSSTPSAASPTRPTCWRLTPPSKQRVPVIRVAGLPW